MKTTNTVQAQADQEFLLTEEVTFAPDTTVSDNYSISEDTPGLCGSFAPTSFSCETFGAADAYLDATTNQAIIKLNWDATLINTTLSCNFEYYSVLYEATWVGDSFGVKINDPCLEPITYTVVTSTGETDLEYGMGQD